VESTTPEALPTLPAPKQAEGKDGTARTESRGHKRGRDEITAPEAAEKGQRPEKKQRPSKEDKADKPSKGEKAEKPAKPAKAEKTDKKA
jgi:hypothetical protein